MENSIKTEKMTFKSLYDFKRTEFRNEICRKLGGIPLSTFYKKLAKNSFTYPEQLIIAGYLGRDINELFPKTIKEPVQ